MDQRYRPAKGRANWATAFLVVHGILMIASIASNIAEIGLLRQIESGKFVPYARVEANDIRQTIIWLMYIASYIAAIVAFLMWINLASKNLTSLRASNQRFSPGWAVGWWFIPIMHLFRPYQVVTEIWKGSYPQIRSDNPDAWANSSASPLLGFWWVTWLVSTLGYWIGNWIIDAPIEADIAIVASDVVSMVSLILVIILIRQITSNQDIKHAYGASVPASSTPGGGRYCAQCGAARASADARFCTACGAAL